MDDEQEKKLALSPLKYSSLHVHNKDHHKEHEDAQNGEEKPAIKSVAIVKQSQVEFPVSFRELQSNTDLKTPPSNWLRGQFSVCFPNLTPKRSDFTSFIMGYQFPDCIGDVDIVSDAENIKKLLKMAYKPNAHLSMMVHRIGKTILIDEFDIYKYLLRQSQCEWKWLKKFFYEHVLVSLARKEQNVIVKPNKSRDVVQNKNLLSKFLYHSLGDEEATVFTKETEQEDPNTVTTISSPMKECLTEPLPQEAIPDPSVQSFTRNIIWNFEDLQMLIGTDLPIFGGRTHPCVSLRLKDMDKPISILTGIDYWLDNLMCNVPEVVMCYHQNGIVQKYELIKTEDLPYMPDSQFSPQLVRDIAHNILSFLKSKATKEGHTYWLFKAKDDDIVKLYDLTSLGGGGSADEGVTGEDEDNPFTVPVAMLLYCVAKNVWASKEDSHRVGHSSLRSPTVLSLLQSALNLLRVDKYPKIVCHAHFILADLYLPQDIDPDNPRFLDIDDRATKSQGQNVPNLAQSGPGIATESKKKKKGAKKTSEFNSIHMATLCGPHNSKGLKHKTSDPPLLSNNIFDRCNSAIRHVIKALSSLELCPSDGGIASSSSPSSGSGHHHSSSSQSGGVSDIMDEPRMAKQYEPIPMRYEPLNKKDANTLPDYGASNADDALQQEPIITDALLGQGEFNTNTQIEKEVFNATPVIDNDICQMEPDKSYQITPQVEPNNAISLGVPKVLVNNCMSKLPASKTLPHKGRKKITRTVVGPPSEEAGGKTQIVPKVQLTGAVLTSHFEGASWVDKMRFQLLRKASLAYMAKGRLELNAGNYGFCLRHVKLALRAWCSMLSLLGPDPGLPLPPQPLLLAGDAYYNLSKRWALSPSNTEDFNKISKEQIDIGEIMEKISPETDGSWLIKIPCDPVESMRLSYKCFEAALSSCGSISGSSTSCGNSCSSSCSSHGANPDCDILRRLASICNELGCMYMNQADQMYQKLNRDLKVDATIWEESEGFLTKAFDIFRQVDDKDNIALLHCNKGRFLRLFAYHTSNSDGEQTYSPAVKRIYEKAFDEYEQALSIMTSKQSVHVNVAESIVWEYSTTLFGFATLIQDRCSTPDEVDEDRDKYVATLLNKCLKLCERKSSGTREPLYKYRAAVIHIRLAAMYHGKYRRKRDGKILYLAEIHYKKCAAIFIQLDTSSADIFKAHLDYVVLLEDSLQGTKFPFKIHLAILKQLCGCVPGLILEQKTQEDKKEDGNKGKKRTKARKKHEENNSGTTNEQTELLNSFLELMQKKLHKTLLELLKLARLGKSTSCYESQLKEMYTLSLNQSNATLETHLLKAFTAITPMLEAIWAKFGT